MAESPDIVLAAFERLSDEPAEPLLEGGRLVLTNPLQAALYRFRAEAGEGFRVVYLPNGMQIVRDEDDTHDEWRKLNDDASR